MLGLLRRFENNKVFTEDESWMLFKLAAIAEAVGWTLLIIGIALSKYVIPNNQIPVQLAGHIHGLFFLLYALAAIGLYPTMNYSRKYALVALLASVPPYGSLLFEQYASFMRKNRQFDICKSCIYLRILSNE